MGAEPLRSDAASLVESSAEAAFAVAAGGRIVAWNAAAESLLGVSAQQALDRRCHELLAGIDVFGNLYCRGDCALQAMARDGQPIRGFRLDLRHASGEFVRVELAVMVMQSSQTSERVLVHLLRPASGSVEPNHFLERMRAGANRIHRTLDGEPRADGSAGGAGEDRPGLTQREVEVLRLLADGRNPDQISAALGVSVHTIRTHVQHILKKLGVHSALHAVSEALRRRLI